MVCKNKESVKISNRKYYLKMKDNPEYRKKRAKNTRIFVEKNGQKVKNRLKIWAEKNPEKLKAQQLVRQAVFFNKIQKEPCEVCGEVNVHGHHYDYNKPLDVKWLCPLHHSREHSKQL